MILEQAFSSIGYLSFLPVNKIKIDKALNDRFLQMQSLKAMESIISLVHSLELKVVAEGVENKEQLEKLKACGCECIQGYIFSRTNKRNKFRNYI